MQPIKITMILLFALTAAKGFSQVFFGNPAEQVKNSFDRSTINTGFGVSLDSHWLTGYGFGSASSFHEQGELLDHVLRDKINLHPLYGFTALSKRDDQTFNFSSNGLYETSEYQIQFQGVPVCEKTVKVHSFVDGTAMINGHIPHATPLDMNMEWPARNQALKVAVAEVAKSKGLTPEKLELIRESKCLYDHANFGKQNNLEPAWEFTFQLNGLPFNSFSNGQEVFAFESRLFDATATAKVYDTNGTNGSLKNFTIDVDANGYLTNDYFTTAPEGVSRVSGSSFTYDPSTQQFAEVMSYTQVNLQYTATKTWGYTWQGEKPMNIINHAILSKTTNNALYQPADSTSDGKPRISIGDGDGSVLKNLGIDSDVVSHEFGHHVIYQTVKSTSGESLVLHEGLADFFAYARTGDACLGESICPSSSTACIDKGKCLRKGTFTASELSYGNATYLSYESHLRGQLVNGMLWDMKLAGMSLDDIATIAQKGLGIMVKDSDLDDLIFAMLKIDSTAYSGKNAQKIYDAAKNRGFTTALDGVNPADPSTFKSPNGASGSSDDSSSSDSKKGWFFGCGRIAANDGTFDAGMILLLLLVPCLMLVDRMKSRKLAPVSTRKSRKG